MKNFLKRSKKNSDEQTELSSGRITNETVAEHREQILAGGRKFKYPLQYQKHRLVLNSIIIGVATLLLLGALGWYQLYVAQNSNKLLYRATQIIPVTVASVDGEAVRYSDYLVRYRSSVFYLQQQNQLNLNSDDGKRQSEYMKREELTKAERSAYASKLARELKLSVSDEEVTAFIKKDVDARSVSLNAYEKTVLKSFYDWSLDEYRSIVKSELLKRKVSLAVDTAARKEAEQLLAQVKAGADIADVAQNSSDDEVTKAGGGDSGRLPLKNQDPNGLIAAASRLNVGELSEVLEGVDGFYFIKLTHKDDSTVQYSLVKIGLTAFDNRFAALQKDGKIQEYITIKSEE
ncbi:MAG TPA: peptidylprolyl isomerase [Candidatus Saccharibacteria bacterium]|nr:peptidylprolyl isomerase [Candidatus Saccharibacteria bacterium]